MASFNFGNLEAVIAAAAKANIGRDTSPVYSSSISTSSFNMGNFSEASFIKQKPIGNPSTFIWSIHRWDDGIHKVE